MLIWIFFKVESTGSTIVCAFETGVIRMITVAVLDADANNKKKGGYVKLIQVLKPHTKSITIVSLNLMNNILVTGSEDSTVFVFLIEKTRRNPSLIPMGYLRTPSTVTCMAWKPEHVSFLTKILM